MTHSFRWFLHQQIHRQDPVGELAREVMQDPAFPPSVRTYKKAHRSVLEAGADAARAAAFEEAWKEYASQSLPVVNLGRERRRRRRQPGGIA